jgi:zeta-carotene desaturase
LHLLPSLAAFRDLAWRDVWAIARAMMAILRQGDMAADEAHDETMLDWLQSQRQTPQAIEYFWRAILTSALNEDLERISARHAFKVFWESFLRNRRSYRMGVPTASLSDLYSGETLSRQCRITRGVAVDRMEVADSRPANETENQISRLVLQNGDVREADFYVSAVPPDALARLLPAPILALWPALERLAHLEWAPITGIHLWFDRPISDLEHTAILGRTVQWMFNKEAITGRTGQSSEGHYVQFVVSASRTLATLHRDEIVAKVLEEVHALFPASRDARLLKSVVVKETESTISFPPGTDSLRPGPQSPIANLFLAGDWTATGWPPTMEGAVRSGYRAAERVTAAAGTPRQFLVPDLPTDPLARLLRRSGKQ